MKHITIVVPVYNEAQTLELLYREVSGVMQDLPYRMDFMFVDDGSADMTADILARLAAEDDAVRVLQFSRNFGKEAATTAGIVHTDADAVVVMDADLQHPPTVLPELLKKWEAGAEVVVGVRMPRKGEGLVRRLGSRLFSYLMNTIGDTASPAGATDFRVIDAAVVRAFATMQEHGRLTRALIDWLGFRRAYVHFVAQERVGAMRYGYPRLFNTAFTTIIAHSRLPLMLAGYLGTCITILAGILGLFILIEQPLLGDPLGLEVSGTAMLAVMIMFLNGVVLAALGLMSAYIGVIHTEVSARPLYIVRSSINFEAHGKDK